MKLDVYGVIAGRREQVGSLETFPGVEERFTYDPSFAAAHPGIALSVGLPQRPQPFGSWATRAYFSNLLPEGDALAAVSRELEIKSTSYLRILEALGRECIGALSLVVPDEPSTVNSGYRELSADDMALLAGGERSEERMALLQVGSKLSLAGAQMKTGLLCLQSDGERRYAVPFGDAASSHIVKSSARRFEELNENEWCCLQLAAACGLRVAPAWVEYAADGSGNSLLVEERFDRVVEASDASQPGGKGVLRLHQEDFCQVLGKLPVQKYEQPGQQHAQQVARAIAQYSADPVADLNDFIRLLVLNVVVGNCDGHIKNSGFLRTPDWHECRLTPAYDVASTVVYSGLDRTLAMRIGSAGVVDAVQRDDFAILARDLRVSQRGMDRRLDEVIDAVRTNVDSIVQRAEENCGHGLPRVRRLAEYAHSSCNRLARR